MVASFAALAACQFQPALGPNSAAGTLFENVAIQAPRNSDEFALVAQMQRRLGHAVTPQWKVTYKISQTSQRFSGDDANRFQLSGNVDFVLSSTDRSSVQYSDAVSGFVNYTQARSSVTQTAMVLSNRAAENDAQRRLMALLADRMVDRMIVELARTKP